MPDGSVIIIGVIGAGDCDHGMTLLAEDVGRLVAEAGCALVTGGRTGVMEAASKGASEAGGLVIGILPGADGSDANPFVGVPIVTGMGEARNVIIARTADALIAIGGEYGTLSEVAFGLKFGKPVVVLNSSWGALPNVLAAKGPAEAVKLALARVPRRALRTGSGAFR